jgi:hypothetical protein
MRVGKRASFGGPAKTPPQKESRSTYEGERRKFCRT